jgi:16S rRNA (cytosine967-C5)-methyltransferase
VVPLGLDAAAAVERLRSVGIEARPVGAGSGAVEIGDGSAPTTVLGHLPAVVQDPGAALVCVYADPPPGELLADLCAAPGGKALALSGRASYVLAADRSLPRLRLLRENLSRTGRRGGLVQALAERPPLREAGFVLLDAPCSGTGTFRRHPDARWRLDPGDPPRMAEVQRRMLEGAAGVVSSGGVLVYSTCTLEPEENEEQVERFLAEHGDFTLDPTGAVEPGLLDRGRLYVLPQKTGFDGAFAVRLRRNGRPSR